MLHRHDEPIETPDAGHWSGAFRGEADLNFGQRAGYPHSEAVEAAFARQRRETRERDRGDALGALTWLSDLFWLGVLVAASIAVGACVVALAT